jgi:hypothetical protein
MTGDLSRDLTIVVDVLLQISVGSQDPLVDAAKMGAEVVCPRPYLKWLPTGTLVKGANIARTRHCEVGMDAPLVPVEVVLSTESLLSVTPSDFTAEGFVVPEIMLAIFGQLDT